MIQNFKNKKILITGGTGFLGSALVNRLKKLKCKKIYIVKRNQYDLVSQTDVRKVFKKYKPNIVFHLAAAVGGIGINSKNPGKFFYENAIMNLNLIHHSFLNKVEKIISTGSVSAYPKNTSLPFDEKDIWKGYPDEVNSSYGIAKRIIHTHSLSYFKQYKFKSILALLTNLYGPNDNFNPNSSHVIAALIKKFYEGKKNNKKFVEVWGDGSSTRDFCFVEDIVEGLILVAKKYNKTDPINLGSGKEISIKKIALLIKEQIGFKGKIKWQKNKPSGSKRRLLKIKKAKQLGFRPNISIEQGIKRTIEWYLDNYKKIK